MNKLSINNIFNINNDNKEKQEILSIGNMFSKINESDIKNKIEHKKIRRSKELQTMYDNKYKDCLSQINISLNNSDENIFFHIPYDNYKKHCDYSSSKCLELIAAKLNENGFYTEIISCTQIYISWRNIHSNENNTNNTNNTHNTNNKNDNISRNSSTNKNNRNNKIII